ncbi:unnamed protein product [Amoebophrya sp. A120]|nr:unnamed protein product [Amoebophrya sp. A120]|eukprot:GSA120T00017995001.1
MYATELYVADHSSTVPLPERKVAANKQVELLLRKPRRRRASSLELLPKLHREDVVGAGSSSLSEVPDHHHNGGGPAAAAAAAGVTATEAKTKKKRGSKPRSKSFNRKQLFQAIFEYEESFELPPVSAYNTQLHLHPESSYVPVSEDPAQRLEREPKNWRTAAGAQSQSSIGSTITGTAGIGAGRVGSGLQGTTLIETDSVVPASERFAAQLHEIGVGFQQRKKNGVPVPSRSQLHTGDIRSSKSQSRTRSSLTSQQGQDPSGGRGQSSSIFIMPHGIKVGQDNSSTSRSKSHRNTAAGCKTKASGASARSGKSVVGISKDHERQCQRGEVHDPDDVAAPPFNPPLGGDGGDEAEQKQRDNRTKLKDADAQIKGKGNTYRSEVVATASTMKSALGLGSCSTRPDDGGNEYETHPVRTTGGLVIGQHNKLDASGSNLSLRPRSPFLFAAADEAGSGGDHADADASSGANANYNRGDGVDPPAAYELQHVISVIAARDHRHSSGAQVIGKQKKNRALGDFDELLGVSLYFVRDYFKKFLEGEPEPPTPLGSRPGSAHQKRALASAAISSLEEATRVKHARAQQPPRLRDLVEKRRELREGKKSRGDPPGFVARKFLTLEKHWMESALPMVLGEKDRAVAPDTGDQRSSQHDTSTELVSTAGKRGKDDIVAQPPGRGGAVQLPLGGTTVESANTTGTSSASRPRFFYVSASWHTSCEQFLRLLEQHAESENFFGLRYYVDLLCGKDFLQAAAVDTIEKNLQKCEALLLVPCADWNRHPWVLLEVYTALRAGVPIVPLIFATDLLAAAAAQDSTTKRTSKGAGSSSSSSFSLEPRKTSLLSRWENQIESIEVVGGEQQSVPGYESGVVKQMQKLAEAHFQNGNLEKLVIFLKKKLRKVVYGKLLLGITKMRQAQEPPVELSDQELARECEKCLKEMGGGGGAGSATAGGAGGVAGAPGLASNEDVALAEELAHFHGMEQISKSCFAARVGSKIASLHDDLSQYALAFEDVGGALFTGVQHVQQEKDDQQISAEINVATTEVVVNKTESSVDADDHDQMADGTTDDHSSALKKSENKALTREELEILDACAGNRRHDFLERQRRLGSTTTEQEGTADLAPITEELDDEDDEKSVVDGTRQQGPLFGERETARGAGTGKNAKQNNDSSPTSAPLSPMALLEKQLMWSPRTPSRNWTEGLEARRRLDEMSALKKRQKKAERIGEEELDEARQQQKRYVSALYGREDTEVELQTAAVGRVLEQERQSLPTQTLSDGQDTLADFFSPAKFQRHLSPNRQLTMHDAQHGQNPLLEATSSTIVFRPPQELSQRGPLANNALLWRGNQQNEKMSPKAIGEDRLGKNYAGAAAQRISDIPPPPTLMKLPSSTSSLTGTTHVENQKRKTSSQEYGEGKGATGTQDELSVLNSRSPAKQARISSENVVVQLPLEVERAQGGAALPPSPSAAEKDDREGVVQDHSTHVRASFFGPTSKKVFQKGKFVSGKKPDQIKPTGGEGGHLTSQNKQSSLHEEFMQRFGDSFYMTQGSQGFRHSTAFSNLTAADSPLLTGGRFDGEAFTMMLSPSTGGKRLDRVADEDDSGSSL